jgi:hypothetical protein
MFWDDAGALFVRLCFAGPLLYIGALLLVDPESFAKFADQAAHEMRAFEQRLNSRKWNDTLLPPRPAHISAGTRIGLRGFGVALCLLAMASMTSLSC